MVQISLPLFFLFVHILFAVIVYTVMTRYQKRAEPLQSPSVVLASFLVGVDFFKGSKCMFETVFDLSAGGIIM